MVPYDPISALEKREAEKEQEHKALRASIIFDIIVFIGVLFTVLTCKRLGLR